MPAGRRFAAVPIVLLAAILVLSVALPALADARDISVGGVFITRLTADAPPYDSYQRAVAVNKRITDVLGTPRFRRGAVVTVRQAGPDALISVGDMLVFTVTPLDAAGTSVTTAQLARQWAALLAQGLGKALPDSTFHF